MRVDLNVGEIEQGLAMRYAQPQIEMFDDMLLFGNYIVNSLRGRKRGICTTQMDAKQRTETKLCTLATVARS